MRGIKAVISQSHKLKRAQTSEPQPRSQGSLLPIPTNVRLPFTHSTIPGEKWGLLVVYVPTEPRNKVALKL